MSASDVIIDRLEAGGYRVDTVLLPPWWDAGLCTTRPDGSVAATVGCPSHDPASFDAATAELERLIPPPPRPGGPRD